MTRRLDRTSGWWVGLVVLACGMVGCAGARAEGPAEEQAAPVKEVRWTEAVDASIRLAERYLARTQPDGSWEPADGAPDEAGLTSAVAVTGMLYSGHWEREPIRPALAALRRMNTDSTAARAMRATAILERWPNRLQAGDAYDEARRDATIVLNSVAADDGGPWVHARKAPAADADPRAPVSIGASAAAVALFAEANFEIPEAYWKHVDAKWRTYQGKDGDFDALAKLAADGGERAADRARVAAQAAYVLAECGRVLAAEHPNKVPASPTGGPVERAIAYLGARWDDLLSGDRPCEGAYWMARACYAAGARWVGNEDWAERIMTYLLTSQRADGSWGGSPRETGYALMATRFCRAPVVIQKLRYNVRQGDRVVEGPWNQRPADAADMARSAGKQFCSFDMTWCHADLTTRVDRLNDVPILYISGDKAPAFTEAERAVLRRYVEAGGLIVGNADNGSAAFADAFRRLGMELFPDYAFRGLGESDRVLNCYKRYDQVRKWPAAQGMSNGARELMILLPDDPGLLWQIRRHAGDRGLGGVALATNLCRYVMSQSMPRREETFADSAAVEAPAQRAPGAD